MVQMTDPGKATSTQAKDNVTMQVHMFLTTTRDDGSDLIDSGSVVPAQVHVWINSDVGSDIELLLICRHFPEDLMGLLVHVNIGVVLKQHDIEVSHGGWVQVWVPCQSCIISIVRIKDVELGIAWLNIKRWKESTHVVMKRSMEDECIGPRAREDNIIEFGSKGGESKGSIVLPNMFPELLLQGTTAFE